MLVPFIPAHLFYAISFTMEDARRKTIIELRRAGKAPADIFRDLKSAGYSRSTVYRVIKAFDEEGKTDRAIHNSRKDKIRSPRFLAGLKRSVDSNPTIPMSVLAKKRNVSRRTISRAINDLGYRSRTRGVKHLLTEAMKQVRFERGRHLLNVLKSSTAGQVRFFSDEKIFTVDRVINRRNDRWISDDASKVVPAMRSKKPTSVMLLSVISSDGDIMPPHFFNVREKVNADVYVGVLQSKVIPWMKAKANGRPFIFQQDSAPSHTAKKTLKALEEADVDFWSPKIWPSNSPDLNPCDYYLWSRVESEACKTPHGSINSLKKSIKVAMNKIDTVEVIDAVAAFRRRLEAVIAAEGGHIEK